ncbi:hypothetical protein ACP2AV_10205 [Aliiroseovarius sp. PTFE2010]|uniref:hypothetical protein n=1 Tax=Aliiroseovarius sp. PTFE2010 TaxID=3417190 RepID=UPI003CFAFC89
MNDFLPKEVRDGLEMARKAQLLKSSRLCVHAGDKVYRVLRLWGTGFAMDAEDAPKLRGLVDLYDGPSHLYQALIVTSDEDSGERIFEFKRATQAQTFAPRDYSVDENQPIALLGNT